MDVYLEMNSWINNRPKDFGTITIGYNVEENPKDDNKSDDSDNWFGFTGDSFSKRIIEPQSPTINNNYQTNNIEFIEPEIIGQSLKGDLEFLASTHFYTDTNNNDISETTRSVKYPYFIPQSSPIDTIYMSQSNETPALQQNVDKSSEFLFRRFQKYDYVPPISDEAYSKLNKKKKNPIPEPNSDNGKDTAKPKRINNKIPSVALRELENIPKKTVIEEVKPVKKKVAKTPPREFLPETMIHEFVEKRKTTKKPNKREFIKYQPAELQNLTPKGIKDRNPVLYEGKTIESNSPIILVENTRNQVPSTAQAPSITNEDIQKALAEKLEKMGPAQEWSIQKLDIQDDTLFSESSDDSLSFLSSESLDFPQQRNHKKVVVDPNETEAVKLRNQYIKQKLALIDTQKEYEKMEEQEREKNIKEVAQRISPMIKKLEENSKIPEKDTQEILIKKLEDEQRRVAEMNKRLRSAKKTEFIAKREEKLIKKQSKRNAKIKNKMNQETEFQVKARIRAQKNQELHKMWDPNPSIRFAEELL